MSVAKLKMSDKMSVKAICSLYHGCYTVYHHFLCNRSNKGHGSGCTTALSGMRNYFYCVYCLTPPTSLWNSGMDTKTKLVRTGCQTLAQVRQQGYRLTQTDCSSPAGR